MITKTFGIDFDSSGGALTLDATEVSSTAVQHGTPEKYSIPEKWHSSGWTIKGEIQEDGLIWVNEFEAKHPLYGRVWGNFEDKVYADSEEGYKHFWQNHEPYAWDYADI